MMIFNWLPTIFRPNRKSLYNERMFQLALFQATWKNGLRMKFLMRFCKHSSMNLWPSPLGYQQKLFADQCVYDLLFYYEKLKTVSLRQLFMFEHLVQLSVTFYIVFISFSLLHGLPSSCDSSSSSFDVGDTVVTCHCFGRFV